MARGWESKSVESQMEEAAEARQVIREAAILSETQLGVRREIEVLELTRLRVVRDLDATMNPRHQHQLRAALGHIDEKLAGLRRRA